ncbi:adenosylcobinamide-GDP ribazoletransferase [Ruminococcus flavefaciens]|uniref:adenosylcobinamide-GDP ribazoletransferase n=1 Tax=Ruminococcus flavefaciens TaxID=1265 RepID=UPI0004920594|nr:adenosylcobinamide-GDP ribazoletransferase [Ruminococcus flavefaciens]
MLKSFISAFQMYSRIPMPKVEWNEKNRRYSLCFFPVIGAVIGVLTVLWQLLCERLCFGSFMFGAVVMLINILVTGGIHLDGFCDTCDARASWGDKEKKLAILKDSHIGAFAAIKLGVYLIVSTAALSELFSFEGAVITGLGYVLSRSLSGLTAVTFRGAKKEGTLQSFTEPAHKKITLIVLSAMAVLSCTAMMLVSLSAGAAVTAAVLLAVLYYRCISYREFGGITGDLAGWFLQMCELVIALTAAIVLRLTEVI